MVQPLYIIRNATNNDYAHKLVWSIGGVMACYRHYQIKNNLEYLNIFTVASLFWTFVEYRLATLGTREGKIQSGTLFGRKLGKFSSGILRGCAEGGSLTLMGNVYIIHDLYFLHFSFSILSI